MFSGANNLTIDESLARPNGVDKSTLVWRNAPPRNHYTTLKVHMHKIMTIFWKASLPRTFRKRERRKSSICQVTYKHFPFNSIINCPLMNILERGKNNILCSDQFVCIVSICDITMPMTTRRKMLRLSIVFSGFICVRLDLPM